MRHLMKLSLGAAILAVVVGCEGTTESSGPGTDAGTTAKDSGGGTDGGSSDGAGGDSAFSSCTLPSEASQGDATCDKCQQTKCCDKIVACLNDKDCKKVFDCTQACFNTPDDAGAADGGGGSADAGAADAGGVDACWNACTGAATPAASTLFDAQDSCVSNLCATECQ
jgi:hypothetical protein